MEFGVSVGKLAGGGGVSVGERVFSGGVEWDGVLIL